MRQVGVRQSIGRGGFCFSFGYLCSRDGDNCEDHGEICCADNDGIGEAERRHALVWAILLFGTYSSFTGFCVMLASGEVSRAGRVAFFRGRRELDLNGP